MVATAVVEAAAHYGWDTYAYGHEWLDITDAAAVRRLVIDVRPEAIVHTAAQTRVNHCQQHPVEAMRVNRDGTGHIVAAAAECGVPVVYLSTDYVFNGRCERPWVESDKPEPLNVYGESKLAGETLVRAYSRGHVVRTSGVFGGRSGGVAARNFFSAIAARLQDEAVDVPVVADQFTAVTYAPHLAGMLLRLMDEDPAPVTHITSAGSNSWYGWALLAAGILGADPRRIQRIDSTVGGDGTPRPAYSVLGSEQAQVQALVAGHPAEIGIQAYFELG